MMKEIRFSIQGKLIIGSLLIILFSVLSLGYYNYSLEKNNLQNQILDNANLIAEAKEGQLLEFLQSFKEEANHFVSDGNIQSETKAIAGGSAAAESQLSNYLTTHKLPLDKSLAGIIVIDNRGNTVASTNNAEIGKSEVDDDYFIQGRYLQSGNIYLSDIVLTHHFNPNELVIATAAPIFDGDTGTRLGVLVNFINISQIDDILSGARQIALGGQANINQGQTGLNLYLVNKDKYIITGLNTYDALALNEKADIYPVNQCLADRTETKSFYTNSQGQYVAGASMCLAYNGWTLIAENDTGLAFQGLNAVRNSIFISTGFILLFSLLIIYFFVGRLVRPIRALTKSAAEAEKGNYNDINLPPTNDQLGDLTATFNKLIKSIRDSQKEKNDFITSASHQIRTPFSEIYLEIEVLKEKLYKKKCDIKIAADLNDVDKSIHRVTNIINDLFKILELGEQYAPINLNIVKVKDVVAAILNSLSAGIKDKKIEVKTEIPDDFQIKAAESDFKTALLNLIDNAVTYTRPGGAILIDALSKNGHQLISVSDNGIGIPIEEQINIFEKFFRASNSYSKKTVGTGLGLSIAKIIIEGHRGKIWFVSQENKGTTFYVELPE